MKYLPLLIILIYCNLSQAQSIDSFKLNDTRTYEVTAAYLPDNKIIAVWMEARQERIVSEQAKDMQVAYAISDNFGKTWTNKKIIDKPNTLVTGNPNIISDKKGNTYLIMMHVGKNFFSGELALYEFENKQNEFKLKSIPIYSDRSLLDKPSLSICGNQLYLTYVEYSNMLDTGLVKIQSSSNGGKTWSDSQTILPESNVIALGSTLACSNDNLFLSFGSFWQNSIYFTKKNAKNVLATFQPSKIISGVSDTLVSAMTEMVTNNENKIAIGWENNHHPNEIYVSLSNNNGKNWNKPILITKSGNMLSMAFDKKNDLWLIYNEFDGNQFSVIRENLSSINGNIKNKSFILKPETIKGAKDYVGAFQKMIITDKNIVMAFWINFSDNNKLYFSKWKVEN